MILSCLSLCVSPATHWQPVQGVPCHSSYGSWNRLQSPDVLELDRPKRMDGWLVCEWRPWCWTLWITVVSGAWPLASSVIKPQLSVLVEPQTLWERNCHFLWLAVQNSDIIQGKWEVTPPRLGRDSNYVRLWPFWWPFKIPWFSSLHWMDGNRGGISVMLLLLFWGCMWSLSSATPMYPNCCVSPLTQPSPCLHTLQQMFPIGGSDGCNHTCLLYCTLHESYGWKYPFCSCEISLSLFWVDRAVNI